MNPFLHCLKYVPALLLYYFPAIVAQELPFTYYTPNSEIHPLPSATIPNMYQDNQGFIWFCNYSSGMVRYDGQSMEVYTENDGLLSVNVMCAVQDKSGRLWVASDVGLSVSEKPLNEYTEGKRIRFTIAFGKTKLAGTSISQVALNCLAMDKSGAIYLATTGLGVVQYRYINRNEIKADTLTTNLKNSNINSIVYVVYSDNNGDTWAGTDAGLMKLDIAKNKFILYDLQNKMPQSNVYSIAELSDGNLWGGCADGSIWKIEKKNDKKNVIIIGNKLIGTIYGIKEYPHGNAWITSYNSGMIEMDINNPLKYKHYTRRNGLMGENVNVPLIDNEGNLWIPQTGGVSKLRKNFRAFEHYTANTYSGKATLPTPGVHGIELTSAISGKEELWACTGNGVTVINPDGSSETFGVEKGLSNNTTYDVYIDSKKRAWVGTLTGVDCLSFNSSPPPMQQGKTKNIIVKGKPASLNFYDIGIVGVCNAFPMRENLSSGNASEAMWFNSYRSVSCFVDEQWFIFNDKSGLPASIMYSLTVDDNGYVYVGTGDKGLYRSSEPLTVEALKSRFVEKGIAKKKTASEGIAGRAIKDIIFKPYWNSSNGSATNEIKELIWNDKTLWVGTTNALYTLKNGELSEIDSVKPAPGSKIVDGYCGAYSPVTKTFWFCSNDGLLEIDPAAKQVIRIVTKEDGLLNNEVNWLEGVYADKKGRIFISHPTGISIYQPLLDQRNEKETPLAIRKVSFSEDVKGNNEFAVNYAGLSYANEKMIRYKTRLEGYDKEWSPPKTEPGIRYTNLPAYLFDKEYVFEIIASNNSGVWNKKPIRYSVIVTPALWFRWWAFFIYIAAFIGIARSGKWAFENIRLIIANSKSKYISHFKTLELIGEGGMGKVFKAVDINTKKIVAVKVLNSELLKDPENRKRLSAEGHLLSSFNHAHIVKVYETGESHEHGFIAMEYLPGGTLKDYIEKNFPLPVNEIKNIALQICDGLSEIHKANVIHRDIKTNNIMLDENNVIRIMDFGLSKSSLVSTMTSLGTVLGTLGYVAPEQITNVMVDQRTDIFSFGVVLYEMAANQLPFKGENEMALIHAIFNNVPPPPSTINNEITPELDKIIEKCLMKDVALRYCNVEEVREDLAKL